MNCPKCLTELNQPMWENANATTYECSNCKTRICIDKYPDTRISILQKPYSRHSWRGLSSEEITALNDDSEKVLFT